jgi:hypothetical protein
MQLKGLRTMQTIRTLRATNIICFCLWAMACMGCSKPEDAKMVSVRKASLQTESISPAKTLTEAKELLSEENDIVLIGKVGSGALDPFEKEKSIFVMSEAPEDHAGSADHDANECPFCRRKMAEAPLAQVEMVDDNGTPYPYGAAELYGLQVGQIVTVSGRGRYEKETDTLMIKGRTLHTKR